MTIKTWHTLTAILAITACTTLLQIPANSWLSSASLSLIAGAVSLAYMGFSCVLASRWVFIERFYGGLDRMYETHKWLGIWALVFATYHFIFKAKLNTWEVNSIIELTPYWTRMFRQTSFIALGFIIILALNRNIPYKVWRWWHKLSGPLFLIVIFHWLSFKSPIALLSSAGIWLSFISAAGVLAAVYKLFLYPYLAKGGTYKVVNINRSSNTVHLTLEPTTKDFSFHAGQFAFLSFNEPGLREPHPFTIASAYSHNGHLDFVIRVLGDYTQQLHEHVKVGMTVDVRAPHGAFKRITTAQCEIWIGGGVGITPFISWLKDRSIGQFNHVYLVYCFDPQRAFPTLERVQELSDQAQIQLIPNPSHDNKLAQTIALAAESTTPHDIHIHFCGPKGLLKHVQSLMAKNGIPKKNIHYEIFEFR